MEKEKKKERFAKTFQPWAVDVDGKPLAQGDVVEYEGRPGEILKIRGSHLLVEFGSPQGTSNRQIIPSIKVRFKVGSRGQRNATG